MPQPNSNTQGAPQARTYVQATLKNGTVVVSAFTKLAGVENYGRDVFAGRKPFNAWEIVGTTHPASGEAVLVRRRRIYNGSEIASLEEVRSVVGEDHGLDPANFEPVLHVQRGRHGSLHRFTEGNAPEGAVTGLDYPVHTDPARAHGFQKYVILRVAQPAVGDEPGSPEQRFYLERPVSPAPFVEVQGPADADDDDPFGTGE